VAAAGAALDVPLGHKDDSWSFPHRMQIGVACEDLPEEHNRVTLDPLLKDGHGIPAPNIDYTISENTPR
jgi:hypothetical protein